MQTWDINQQIQGLGPDQYLGFTIGSYSWAEPKNDNIAFVAGDYLTDLVLMKSLDNGETWQKRIIWQHPYPMFEIFTFNSDTFYCNDGGITIALDNDGMAHVAFGLSRVYSTTTQDTIWYNPNVAGIAYWQEDMPAFKNTMNALNPDSLSVCDNLVAWSLDLNGNGTIDTIPFKSYPTPGMLTMPSPVISDYGQMFLTFSAITEGYSNGTQNYRHIWFRSGDSFDCSWGNFMDLTSDLLHIFDECVYPVVVPYINDNLQLIYELDNEPGPSLPGPNPPAENQIKYLKVNLWKDKKSEKGIYIDFRINQDTIFEGDTVHFQNLSCGCPFPVSYTWEFEGGDPLTSTEAEPSVIYNEAGFYDVDLTVSNGSSMSTTTKPDYIKVYPLNKLGNDIAIPEMEILPNPCTGLFTIKFNGPWKDKIEIAVFDIFGQKIFENHQPILKDNCCFVDLTTQQEGIYFLQLNSVNTTLTRKLVVKQ
jgi:PKD repeat protein